MIVSSFRELFLYLLSDIFALETKLTVELPKLIKKASSEKLKDALQNHLNETMDQVRRLEKIFKILREVPHKVEWSADIKTLFADMDKFLKDNTPSAVLDAAIIAIAQRVEHFEIATYGTLKSFAKTLEHDEIKDILKESLKEEIAADTVLTKIAEGSAFTSGLNIEATRVG